MPPAGLGSDADFRACREVRRRRRRHQRTHARSVGLTHPAAAQAAVRALSCEVTPGRAGPLAFELEGGRAALSYGFFLQDSRARGQQRWYALKVLSDEVRGLVAAWWVAPPPPLLRSAVPS